MLRRQIKKQDQITRKVMCLPSLKRFSFRYKIGHKIQNINEKLLKINTEADSLGLQDEHPAGPVLDHLYWRETVPNQEEFKIVGRDNDKLHIIELLTQSRKEEKLSIVPIVGMGEIGKTTLAKSVYNDKKIEQHFDVKAWLCVSVKVDINTLLAKIYESLDKKKPTSDLRTNLIGSLNEQLTSKRYLLVLDDVWIEKRPYWEEFRSCMLNVSSQNGSGILVTTRKLEIGTHDMHMDSCLLKGLSDDHCCDIFRERVFVAGTSSSLELEEIGHEIVKKCGGLPLLLNVIGGMLAHYSDIEKWLAIKNSKVLDLEEERDRVQKSLELSFDNLPNSIVKQCFVYCSIFKKDTVMEREELVRIWMALRLVQADEERNKEMEDVGNDIFQILVSNSLFQDVERDEYGHITRCSMHDLVHDLSLLLSKHESLCLEDATNDDIACMPQVKHLAFYQKQNIKLVAEVSMFIERNTEARTLHTLFIEGEVDMKFPFQRLKCIRILQLKCYLIRELDDSIGRLVHLRYLDLAYTKIRVLPESIGKLYHLQTLKLSDDIEQFPEAIRNLISLRYFQCDKNIPANIVGQLTSLQTLPCFILLRRKRHGIEELRHLNNLSGRLCISKLENVRSKEDAFKADLSRKKNLYEIELEWSRDRGGANKNEKDVLEGLQPPRDVKELEITRFYGDNFPEWVMKMAIDIEGKWTPLDKLVSITLYDCRSCLSLPTLEHLPHLQNLLLIQMDSLTCLRSSDVIGSTKPLSLSLRSLGLYFLERLEKWIDGEPNSSKTISPVLEKLDIYVCPKIICLDEYHPHPLVSLRISQCTGLVSIKSIQGLTSLECLEIFMCPSLSDITNLPNQCHSLKTLSINNYDKLTSLPHGMFNCFAFLNELTLGPFSKELDSFPSLQGIEKLSNHLQSLELRGWDHWELMPEELQHLTSLALLCINRFGIKELPMWLTNISSIRKLRFNNCKGLNKETVRRGAPREATDVRLNYGRVLIN
ncbi:unnamed protein product [Lactuca saligna]|uniref:NB-ARC domain-containing protein n=1 Tax=Lactuca saligna TaxID=75948 RepID=A0AA35VL46_LACSI|nr:unnamed protein product [Lactuca saligna]